MRVRLRLHMFADCKDILCTAGTVIKTGSNGVMHVKMDDGQLFVGASSLWERL